MNVTVEVVGFGSTDFEMNRIEVDSGPAKLARKRVKKDNGPQPPRLDARFEGIRALYEGRAVALVYADSVDEIKAVLTAHRDQLVDSTLEGIRSEVEVYDPVDEASRSHTNVVFRLPTEELEARFLAEAEAQNLVNLKGHRSVGGIRASIYNALPTESVEALVAHMTAFAGSNG